ncbi:MAG: hypothetical protein H8D45_14060 [Bacteroidetes bacterium]|nr:hypothetical protein [Bacteroidota bacterium]
MEKKLLIILFALLVISIVISCDSKSSSNTQSGDTTCAYCGKKFVGEDGWLGGNDGMIARAKDVSWADKGSYCSEYCAVASCSPE